MANDIVNFDKKNEIRMGYKIKEGDKGIYYLPEERAIAKLKRYILKHMENAQKIGPKTNPENLTPFSNFKFDFDSLESK